MGHIPEPFVLPLGILAAGELGIMENSVVTYGSGIRLLA